MLDFLKGGLAIHTQILMLVYTLLTDHLPNPIQSFFKIKLLFILIYKNQFNYPPATGQMRKLWHNYYTVKYDLPVLMTNSKRYSVSEIGIPTEEE